MQYTTIYRTPLGALTLAADEVGLAGAWFEGQRYFARGLDPDHEEREVPLLTQTKRWLEIYFSGREPGTELPLHLRGSEFQKEVWALLRTIPYGETETYGEIARRLAEKKGTARVSARAVGGAVARNALSIIIPCHRVVGADGALTGYAGGITRKSALLRLESGLPLCAEQTAPVKNRKRVE